MTELIQQEQDEQRAVGRLAIDAVDAVMERYRGETVEPEVFLDQVMQGGQVDPLIARLVVLDRIDDEVISFQEDGLFRVRESGLTPQN